MAKQAATVQKFQKPIRLDKIKNLTTELNVEVTDVLLKLGAMDVRMLRKQLNASMRAPFALWVKTRKELLARAAGEREKTRAQTLVERKKKLIARRKRLDEQLAKMEG